MDLFKTKMSFDDSANYEVVKKVRLPWNTGLKWDTETRKKISVGLTGREGNRTKRYSDEAKRKISESRKKYLATAPKLVGPNKGKPMSEEAKAKLRATWAKRRESAECKALREKWSKERKGKEPWNKGKKGFLKGRKLSEETKAKLRGPKSEETKAKIRAAMIARHAAKKGV